MCCLTIAIVDLHRHSQDQSLNTGPHPKKRLEVLALEIPHSHRPNSVVLHRLLFHSSILQELRLVGVEQIL